MPAFVLFIYLFFPFLSLSLSAVCLMESRPGGGGGGAFTRTSKSQIVRVCDRLQTAGRLTLTLEAGIPVGRKVDGTGAS